MNRAAIEHTANVLGFADLTPQETVFVQSLLRGLPLAMAGQQAGIPQEELQTFYNRPHVSAVLAHMRESMMLAEVKVDRNMLNLMLFEAHAKAASATEEINAIRELGKMNGLYAPTKVEHVSDAGTKTAEQMKRMSTEELARLAGDDDIIDGEWEEVSND